MLIQRVHVNPKDALPLALLQMHIKLEHQKQNVAHQNTGKPSNETQRQVQAILTWVYSGLCRGAEDRQPCLMMTKKQGV